VKTCTNRDLEKALAHGDSVSPIFGNGRRHAAGCDRHNYPQGALSAETPIAAGTPKGSLGRVAHLVWDWNGTLLNDLALVVAATNMALGSAGAAPVSEEEHRRDFRRPIIDYYGSLLGRAVTPHEFALMDRIFHDQYRLGLRTCGLAADALTALSAWTGTQSLLSMWFHDELVPAVDRFGLTPHFRRIDGLKVSLGGGYKAEHLKSHLADLGLDGPEAVLIGDSVDDADAAASVGARCILYSGGFTAVERLRRVGVPVAGSLTEAVALAANPR
jgi:phosphoglycolate phosphatase-like HAD superfamily hydrolase